MRMHIELAIIRRPHAKHVHIPIQLNRSIAKDSQNDTYDHTIYQRQACQTIVFMWLTFG